VGKPRVLNPYQVQFGWAVGLFDGEGSIGIYNNAVMLRIGMTDVSAIDQGSQKPNDSQTGKM